MGRWDVAVVGGGILGASLAYWLGLRYDGRIAVLEKERDVGAHASGRNTGVVHRPFYLHPRKRRVFARSAQASFPLWKAYAAARGLPWAEVGTLKVAATEEETGVLEENLRYARENGMEPEELELLDPNQVRRLEPEVSCAGALLVHTDTAADFGAFTRAIRDDAEAVGVRFLTGTEVLRVEVDDGLTLHTRGPMDRLEADLLINCAGGSALDLAHAMGLALEYADLHFRGEYWHVSAGAAGLAGRNVYTVPRRPHLPFLEPHWVVRADGRREVGPNAVPVPGPYDYEGLLRHEAEWLGEAFSPPVANKLRLILDREFLGLAAGEVLSSLSRGEMVRHVQRFLPRLREADLTARGTAGVRSQVVDRQGRLVPEAIPVEGPRSFHILNYNSPGATGAPAHAAHLVDHLAGRGYLEGLKPRPLARPPWDWEALADAMDLTR